MLILKAYLNRVKNQLSIFDNWRPPDLSELTPMISNTGLTHLRLKAFISYYEQTGKVRVDFHDI